MEKTCILSEIAGIFGTKRYKNYMDRSNETYDPYARPQTRAQSTKQRFFLLKPANQLVVVLVVGISLWLLSGILFGESKQPERVQGFNKVSTVEIKPSQAKPHVRTTRVFGITKPKRSVSLKAEVDGLVKTISAQEGTMVKKGEVILTIDERNRKERVQEARALLKQAQTDYNATKKLSRKGYRGELSLDQSKAALAAAENAVKVSQLDLSRTKVRAPFDGVLDKVSVEEGDLVSPNNNGSKEGEDGAQREGIATVIQADPFLVVGNIPEKVVSSVRMGMPGEAQLITGERVQGKVTYLANVADPATRTFALELEVPNPKGALKSGVTSEIILPLALERAHYVPSSALTLDDEGQVGVKLFSPNGKTADGTLKGVVSFHEVKLYDETTEGIWVSGLSEQVYVITRGQQFVVDGSTVLGKTRSEKNTSAGAK